MTTVPPRRASRIRAWRLSRRPHACPRSMTNTIVRSPASSANWRGRAKSTMLTILCSRAMPPSCCNGPLADVAVQRPASPKTLLDAMSNAGGDGCGRDVNQCLTATILNAAIGLANPFMVRSPIASASTKASKSVRVLRLVNICPPLASPHRRAAIFVTVPTAP